MASKRSLALLGLLMTVVYSKAASASYRILGGDDSSPGKYPWVASIRVDGAHACVGSIINNQFIITAAHPLSSVESSRVTVRLGSINQLAGGRIHKVASISIHPDYGNFLDDVAILKVDQSIIFSDKINKISLADEDDIIEEGTPISVNGWGLQENGTTPYKLQHVSMHVLSGPECELQTGFGYDSILCLGRPEKTGICRGDDGAGVVSGMKLVGIASFAFGSCGTKYPDISSRVSYYRSWINSIIAQK